MAEEPVKGPASYFPSIEKKYGKPISYWQQLLREYRTQHPDAKHMQQVAWLKSEHGLGHGHGHAIVAATPLTDLVAREPNPRGDAQRPVPRRSPVCRGDH